MLDLSPFAHGAQHQHTHHRHAAAGDDGADEEPHTLGCVARSRALQVDQRVADESSGGTAEQDGDEGGNTGGWRWKSRQGAFSFCHTASVGSRSVRATVVVPTFNEIDNIDRLLREVRAVAPEASVLVVDDGSPDGTADRAEELGTELGHIEVLRRSGKQGLGAAYRAGLRHAIGAGADICVQMDADLSHDPQVLPALIALIEHYRELHDFAAYIPVSARKGEGIEELKKRK